MVKLLLQPAHLLQQPVGVVSGHFRRDLAVGALLDPGHHLQQRGLAHPIRPRHASPPGGRNVDTRNEQRTWPHDTVGGGGGARLIRGDTANGPCQARADHTAACTAKVSEGEARRWNYIASC